MSQSDIHDLYDEGRAIHRLGSQLCAKTPPRPHWSPQLLERKLREVTAKHQENALLISCWARPSDVFVPNKEQEECVKNAVHKSAVRLLNECPELVVGAMVDFRKTGVSKQGSMVFRRQSTLVQDAILVALYTANNEGLPVFAIQTDGNFLATLSGHMPPPMIDQARPNHIRSVLTPEELERLCSKAAPCPAVHGQPWVQNDSVLRTGTVVLLPGSWIPDRSEPVLCNWCYRLVFPEDVAAARCTCLDWFECGVCRQSSPLLKHDCVGSRQRAGTALSVIKEALPYYPVIAIPSVKGCIFSHAQLAFACASTMCNTTLPMGVVELYQMATRCSALEPTEQDTGEFCEDEDNSGSCCFDAAVRALQKKAAKRERQKERKRQLRQQTAALH
jgi:hypothetical protein